MAAFSACISPLMMNFWRCVSTDA